MNVESLYMPVYAGNRLELGESLTGLFDTRRDIFFQNAKDQFGFEDCAYVACTTDNQGRRGDGVPAQNERTRKLWAIPGNLTWALHNYYLHYRHTMNHAIVTNHNKHAFYPLLRANINTFLRLLEKGGDGKLHIPVLISPEYPVPGKDKNYNLALLRWACQTLLELNRLYHLQDPLAARWEETLANLAPYHIDETGFSIAASVPLTKSHRHWSHLQEKAMESSIARAFDHADPRLKPFYETASDLERAAQRMREKLAQRAYKEAGSIMVRRERRAA